MGLASAACGGSNYGYGREYVPSDDEEQYYERAADVSYEEVRRDPKAFEQRLVGWFGVVTGAKRSSDGTVDVALDLRFHQPRHLCSDQFESSCKVTISERQGGPFSTKLLLRPEDTSGTTRFNVGSLVKVYGSPTGEFDDRGGPVLKTQFYRQWPHGAYVTTSGAINMRR
ncbi:MAG TPA: hypothetical protein VJR89_26245 [Polyangiales bacterium]|nr:hypothetical protein [Polyangiales bacterium]